MPCNTKTKEQLQLRCRILSGNANHGPCCHCTGVIHCMTKQSAACSDLDCEVLGIQGMLGFVFPKAERETSAQDITKLHSEVRGANSPFPQAACAQPPTATMAMAQPSTETPACRLERGAPESPKETSCWESSEPRISFSILLQRNLLHLQACGKHICKSRNIEATSHRQGPIQS